MDNTVGRILIVDDNEDILASLRLLLKLHFEEVTTLSSPEKIPEFLIDDFILTSHAKKIVNPEFDTYNLEDIERKIIVRVLKQNQGNITQAAKDLELTRTSLYRRMEKYEI